MAMLAGMVNGVVVPIRPETWWPASAGSILAGSDVRAKRTQMEGLEWLAYSTYVAARWRIGRPRRTRTSDETRWPCWPGWSTAWWSRQGRRRGGRRARDRS